MTVVAEEVRTHHPVCASSRVEDGWRAERIRCGCYGLLAKSSIASRRSAVCCVLAACALQPPARHGCLHGACPDSTSTASTAATGGRSAAGGPGAPPVAAAQVARAARPRPQPRPQRAAARRRAPRVRRAARRTAPAVHGPAGRERRTAAPQVRDKSSGRAPGRGVGPNWRVGVPGHTPYTAVTGSFAPHDYARCPGAANLRNSYRRMHLAPPVPPGSSSYTRLVPPGSCPPWERVWLRYRRCCTPCNG